MTERRATQIRLRAFMFSELDRYAEKLGISRNQLMENLLATGLDDLRLLEKTGALKLGTIIRDASDHGRLFENSKLAT